MITIPSGRTVTVTGNYTYSGAPMRIRVGGGLYFSGGGAKLSLPCNSIIEILSSTASVSGNSTGNSQNIRICGTTFWQVSDGAQAGYLAWPLNSTLPVELLSFTGEQVGEGVQVRWSTATEFNSERFELWRQLAGDPVLAGSLPAAGTTQIVHDYSLRDTPPTTGTWFYTLVQYDLDGVARSFPAIAVTTRPVGGLTCYPVPASEEMSISLTDVPASLVISDANGNVMLRQTLTSTLTRLPLARLPNGPYLAVTMDAGHTRTQRFVVMH